MAGEPGNGQVNSDLKKHFQSAGHKSKILSQGPSKGQKWEASVNR
jgi:hypothetical protein